MPDLETLTLLELKKFYELKYDAQKDYFIFGGFKD